MSDISESDCITHLLCEGAQHIKRLSHKNNRAIFSVILNGQKYAVKFFVKSGNGVTYPFVAHCDILPSIKSYAEHQWRHIVLPDIVRVQPDTIAGPAVWMTWVQGSQIKTQDDSLLLDTLFPLLNELKSIPVDFLIPLGLRFYQQKEIHKDLRKSIGSLVKSETIKRSDIHCIENAMTPLYEIEDSRPFIISNEDFRAANLLRVNNHQIAIIDWDGLRASQFEIEHCLAHMLLFLTEEPETYKRLIDTVSTSRLVDVEIFKACCVLRSIIQLRFWQHQPIKKRFLMDSLNKTLSLN
ncbi:phosphotransferase [Aestuariibacter salexigens]|uniref:phosphotransferase n=1 Tax=Aestuariibacter salexigens TaxID=226010 RepID=UPI000409EF4D|nr:phosphotransferase [Aestuariibacter salexigens]